ncbi:MAG: hypothetical protein SFY92_09955 [Verrucomicrobiae bacterium]|nr:hypothetical protein [Verrucomicrobiae bacterium]
MNPQDPQKHRLEHQQESGQGLKGDVQARQESLEFRTPEELIRHDAQQTVVPATLRPRVGRAIKEESRPSKPWWKKILG